MPIVNDASIICKGPMVALGYGDVYYCIGSAAGSERFEYLLFYAVERPGAIGTVEETCRFSEEPVPVGGDTARFPADVALRFGRVESVDGIIAALVKVRETLLADEPAERGEGGAS